MKTRLLQNRHIVLSILFSVFVLGLGAHQSYAIDYIITDDGDCGGLVDEGIASWDDDHTCILDDDLNLSSIDLLSIDTGVTLWNQGNGDFTNEGTINIIDGELLNDSVLESTAGIFIISADGTFTNTDQGEFEFENKFDNFGIIDNAGAFTILGNLTNYNIIDNSDFASFNIDNYLNNTSTGIITFTDNSKFVVQNIAYSYGQIHLLNSDNITNPAEVVKYLNLLDTSTFENRVKFKLVDSGVINIFGTSIFDNASPGSLSNECGTINVQLPATLTGNPPEDKCPINSIDIISPSTGSTFGNALPVSFTGTAFDKNGFGTLVNNSTNIKWYDNSNPTPFAIGSNVSQVLSSGPHTIKATFTDLGGNSKSATISILIAPDTDADGVIDTSDNCPVDSNPLQENFDGDLLGDACDPTPFGEADLDVTTVGPSTIEAGNTIHYEIKVSNIGLDTAIGVNVTDIIPTEIFGLSLVSASSQCGPLISGQIQCNLPDILAGSFFDIFIDLSIPSGGSNDVIITNTATVSSQSQDTPPFSFQFETTVTPTDTDGDGVPDELDNCPDDSNSDQANLDNDSLGDVCDPDADGDGYISDASNFSGNDCADDNPLIYPGQIEDPFNEVDDNCVNGTDEPLSVADFYDVIGNNQLVVPAPGVLANDLSQNTITSAILHSPAVHPELIWNGDGGFTFNPPVGFTGTYTFSYNATDQYDTISSTAGIVTLTQTELFCGLPISAYTSIIDGTSGNDNLQGTNGNDLIRGFAGDDKINGKKGNDCIYGGSGDDKINGGSGNDTIFGEEGNDKINGNNGDDYISGGDGNDKINGNNGIDTLYGDAGKDTIHGGNDNDYINGGTELDKCYGGNGNNVIEECEILKKFDDDNEGEDSDNNQSNSNHDDKGKSDDKKDDKGKSDDKKDDKGKSDDKKDDKGKKK